MATPHRIAYHFHAEGHGFSGEFRHPLWSVIPAQASASLPTIGGHADSAAENFHFQDFVCFKSAHTFTSGKRRQDMGGDPLLPDYLSAHLWLAALYADHYRSVSYL
ncbi:MAG TPA: hypothetical protein VM709_13155, partial [Candidatus Sulfotelmatobacter sp.]|nr:hypothetical protein [Candidatus Sulfotelmatobacter sp.]